MAQFNANSAEARATKFNESVDYFTLNYGDPYMDCGINLICALRDISDVNPIWAETTICKTIKRMSNAMLKKVYYYCSSSDCYGRFISGDGKHFVNKTIEFLLDERDRRELTF